MTKNSKENFCGVCAAIPLAFASGGSTVVSGTKKDDKKNLKYTMLYTVIYNISVFVTILSTLYLIYYFFISKCNTCNI